LTSIIKQYIETLIKWINELSDIDSLACQSLKTLTTLDDQSFLSLNADCIIHPLVKQILFMNILSYLKPLLVNNDIKSEQMNILIDLLNNVPKTIIKDELKSLLPILIRALTSQNESVWSSALKSICDLIKSEPTTVISYVDTLVPRLSILATFKNDMNIRIISLQCLKHISHLPSHIVLTHRRHVCRILKSCVDDHKRLVRKQAVQTQMAWCLLNEESV